MSNVNFKDTLFKVYRRTCEGGEIMPLKTLL